MANIFLSYDREDEARARPLARLMERAGHSVWWDRHIRGGDEFSAEIQLALNAADKVVVLWSARAINSTWVRDEAAVGRDTGRLVPITIDGALPPLGFRQFQTLDLSGWRGRGKPRQVLDLLETLTRPRAGAAPPTHAQFTRTFHWPASWALLLTAGMLFIGLAAGVAWRWLAPPGVPSFAIIAADASPSSRQLAEEMAARVPALGQSGAANFHLLAADTSPSRDDLALKVSAGAEGARATVTLVGHADDVILWSVPVDAGEHGHQTLVEAASVTAHRALSCVSEGLSHRRERIDPETLKLYLAGCTAYDAAYGTNTPNTSLAKIFTGVIEKAPHFAPAWSRLFEVESEDLFGPNADDGSLAKTARAQLGRARALKVDVPEAFALEASLHSPSDFLGILRTLDDGIAKHPDNALLYRLRGERYSYVGRMNDAVGDTARAVALDPLSPANQQTFASELAYSGDVSAGYAQLHKAEELWPNSPTVGVARYRMDLRFGDPHEALSLYRKYAVEAAVNPAQGKFIEARIDPSAEKVKTALDAERDLNRQFPPFIASLIQALAYFGRKDEALDLLVHYPTDKFQPWIGYNAEVLFRPMMRDVWRDPRAMQGAAHVGLVHYWAVSGKWPDFCFDPALPYDCKREAAKYSAGSERRS